MEKSGSAMSLLGLGSSEPLPRLPTNGGESRNHEQPRTRLRYFCKATGAARIGDFLLALASHDRDSTACATRPFFLCSETANVRKCRQEDWK